MEQGERPLRFGILGAARIAPDALTTPAREIDGAVAAVVAARDRARAEAFTREHGVERVAEGYAELVADPGVDAVYVALPAALHAEWSIRALRAGKHVLCEKPIASNANEAAEMCRVADEEGLVLVEAFHWRYHPMAARILELLAGGAVGQIERIEGTFTVPIADRSDIRYNLALGGGSLMDMGCYPVHWLRTFMGEEPEVLEAEANQDPPGIDTKMTAELRFPGGATGLVRCGMAPEVELRSLLTVTGSGGELRALNPLAPHHGNEIRVRNGDGEHREEVEGRTTYTHQLEAFVHAVRTGGSLPTSGTDTVANMAVIDAIYRAAGMQPRGA